MNRRHFLASLLAGSAGAAISATFDIEKLLWVPKPMVSVPAMPLMFNKNAYAFTMEPIQHLLVFHKKAFYRTFQLGDTISIAVPQRYRIR